MKRISESKTMTPFLETRTMSRIPESKTVTGNPKTRTKKHIPEIRKMKRISEPRTIWIPQNRTMTWIPVLFAIATLLATVLAPTCAATTTTTTTTAIANSYNFTLAFLTAVANKGNGKFVGGAFFLALDHLNNSTEDRLRDAGIAATFDYVYRDTHNKDTTATRAMVEVICDESINVTAFIGPDKFCSSSALLASSYDLPFLSYDCNDIHTYRDTIAKYRTVNVQPSVAYAAKSIVATMQRFEWTSFWLVSGSGAVYNDYIDIRQYLRTLAKINDLTLNDFSSVSLNDEFHTVMDKKPYTKIISEARAKTRVFVFLGNYNSLIEFLREMNFQGVTSQGEHVVIAVTERSNLTSKDRCFMRTDEWGEHKVSDSKIAAFRNVLLIGRVESATDIDEDFRAQVYEKNHQPPLNLARIPDWFLGKKNSMHALKQESFYLYDAVMNYGNAVMDLILKGEDPYNTRLVIDYIRNKTYRSIQGFDVRINEDGESEGRYVVLGMTPDPQPDPQRDPGADPHPVAHSVGALREVGRFLVGEGSPRYIDTNVSVAWVTGSVPVSDPVCGFDGKKCDDGEESEWKLVAVGIGLTVFVLLSVGAVFVGLRYWLIVRRMRRHAVLAASRGSDSTVTFLELQEQDREGLLVC